MAVAMLGTRGTSSRAPLERTIRGGFAFPNPTEKDVATAMVTDESTKPYTTVA